MWRPRPEKQGLLKPPAAPLLFLSIYQRADVWGRSLLFPPLHNNLWIKVHTSIFLPASSHLSDAGNANDLSILRLLVFCYSFFCVVGSSTTASTWGFIFKNRRKRRWSCGQMSHNKVDGNIRIQWRPGSISELLCPRRCPHLCRIRCWVHAHIFRGKETGGGGAVFTHASKNQWQDYTARPLKQRNEGFRVISQPLWCVELCHFPAACVSRDETFGCL